MPRTKSRRRQKCEDFGAVFMLAVVVVIVVPGITMVLSTHGGRGVEFAPMDGATVEELRAFRRPETPNLRTPETPPETVETAPETPPETPPETVKTVETPLETAAETPVVQTPETPPEGQP